MVPTGLCIFSKKNTSYCRVASVCDSGRCASFAHAQEHCTNHDNFTRNGVHYVNWYVWRPLLKGKLCVWCSLYIVSFSIVRHPHGRCVLLVLFIVEFPLWHIPASIYRTCSIFTGFQLCLTHVANNCRLLSDIPKPMLQCHYVSEQSSESPWFPVWWFYGWWVLLKWTLYSAQRDIVHWAQQRNDPFDKADHSQPMCCWLCHVCVVPTRVIVQHRADVILNVSGRPLAGWKFVWMLATTTLITYICIEDVSSCVMHSDPWFIITYNCIKDVSSCAVHRDPGLSSRTCTLCFACT